ncbi:hypothetical protein KAH55_10645, partial [bacterium]|nr:hypothetical protein [bacterium]
GSALSDSVKTKVIDDHGRLMKYFPITYTITSGGGSVNNQSSVTSITNAKGFAAVDWILGPTPGSWNNSMQASAQYDGKALTHSPRLFRATADQGEPTILVVDAQADSQTTAVGGILSKPIRVSVTDPAGNPIIGHPVRFRIVGGGGKINDVTTELVQYVDSNGYAEVNWRIGNTAGWSNFMEVSAEFNDQALSNSPYLFSAYGLPSSATQLIRLSEQNINGTVGEALTSPFQVRVGDTNGNGVSGLSVTFEILSGGGSLNGSTDTLVVATSAVNGIAEAILTLGPTVGVMNTIRVRGFNGEIELQNSPIYFTSTGQPGALNLDASEITCDPATVPAGAEVTVGVRLSDSYGNAPTTRYWIRFYTESEGVTVTQQPSTQTDQNGLVFGKIMCTRSGTKEIKAEVLGAGWITNPGIVFYYPLLAHHIGGQSGDQQTGNVNASLANPLGVTVYDVFGNPVPNSPVHFAAVSGGCEIYEAQPVTTDSTGQAFSHLVLGPNSGTNTASVTATELDQKLYYSATGTISTARHISVYSGNNQIGKAGVELSAPLVVRVTDVYGRPVFNSTVRFSVEFGNGTFRGVEAIGVPTDPLGLATAYFTLDDDIGHNTVRAESPQIYSQYGEFVTFILEGQAGYAEVLKMISGDGNRVQVYSQATLNVQTTDIHGNGVGNIPVSFRVAEGTAEIVQAQPVISNENGYASSTVRVSGAVGDVIVEVTSAGLINSPLQMKLYVTAAQASSMELADGNNQNGTISRDLPFPFEVLVKDSWGNPVPGEIIAWSVIQGSGYISSTTRTGNDGIAKNTLRLGPNAGINEVYALNNSLGAPLPFTAQGVTNKFPIINAIDDITVNENQNINFTVRASDDDGETIFFGAQAGTLPAGAYYDSTGSQQFYWTPTYTDAGEYDVIFLVRDPRGGIGAENVKLTVQNVNRVPVRTSSWPLSYYVTADRLTGQPVSFSITVTDPDPDDTISYQWYLTDKGQKTPDSLLVSTKNTYTYQPLEYPNGAYMVSVIVSDGHDNLRLEWWLSNKDAVELASFSGEAMEYNGVRLTWETSYENNNAGFNILRSAAEDGDYERLTRVPLPASEEMVYEYFDNRVEAGRTYYYRLEDVDMTGKRTMHAPISVKIGRPETFELT